MRELIAVIVLLMIFSSARGEAPEYFNKGAHAAQTSTQTEQGSKNYVVGVDMQEGMYTFFADTDCHGEMIITNWDGSIDYQAAVEPGWVETLRVYNEQIVCLPEGCQGEFNLGFLSSEYDTGTRQFYATAPGVYSVGAELKPGLYIVQNDSSAPAGVRICEKATGKVGKEWNLQPDSHYTIYLKDVETVEFDEGCMLRSMTTQWLFQQGTEAVVSQSRYSTRMQIPGRVYTLKGRDHTSLVRTTVLATGEETTYTLGRDETMVLDTMTALNEMLVELVNVEISWENGVG